MFPAPGNKTKRAGGERAEKKWNTITFITNEKRSCLGPIVTATTSVATPCSFMRTWRAVGAGGSGQTLGVYKKGCILFFSNNKTHCFFNCDFAKRIHGHFHIFQVDASAVRLDAHFHGVVYNAFDCHEDTHLGCG